MCRAAACRLTNPRFVVIQHVTDCDLSDLQLLALWRRALLVSSFHDLPAWVAKRAPHQQEGIR